MNHEKIKSLVASEIYGDNSAEESRAVKLHLGDCVECRGLQSDWLKAGAQIPTLIIPQEDAFWIRQRSAIMNQLPKQSSWGWNWHHLAGPIAAVGLVISAWGLHERQIRTDIHIAQNMDMLQDMDMLQQLDVMEQIDNVLEKK